MIVGPADGHFERLRAHYPAATIVEYSDGSKLVTVPRVQLPPGWNQSESDIHFIVPVGYPLAGPDCFFADQTLRLGNNSIPKNAAVQAMPNTTDAGLWFSWHIVGWNPTRDDFISALRTFEKRFQTSE